MQLNITETVAVRRIALGEFHNMEFDANDPYLCEVIDGVL